MTSSITWRRWRGTSCGRGLRKKSLDSNQRKSASTPPVPLRRPPPARPRKPCLAPPTRRVQEDGAPAQASHDGSPLLGRAGQGLGRVETAPRDRDPRHRPAVAAASLPDRKSVV